MPRGTPPIQILTRPHPASLLRSEEIGRSQRGMVVDQRGFSVSSKRPILRYPQHGLPHPSVNLGGWGRGLLESSSDASGWAAPSLGKSLGLWSLQRMMQQRVQCPVRTGPQGSHPCALPRVWFGSRGSDRPPGHPGDGTAELGLREGLGLSALGQQGPRARNPSRTRPRWRLTLDQCWAVNLALLEPWGTETRVFGEPPGVGAWLSWGLGALRHACSVSPRVLDTLLILRAVPRHGCHGAVEFIGGVLSQDKGAGLGRGSRGAGGPWSPVPQSLRELGVRPVTGGPCSWWGGRPPRAAVPLEMKAKLQLQGLPGGSDGKESAYCAGDLGLIPGSGRPPGGGSVNPLQ